MQDPSETSSRLRRAISSAQTGDQQAAAELVPLLYDELRMLAAGMVRRLPPGQTLQATSLVHEAYTKLVSDEDPGWDGRGHFFAAAGQAMREILVDQARRKGALKRGGERKRVEFDPQQLTIDAPGPDILALHEALTRLEAEAPRKARIVLLRFFAGLTMTEIGQELGISRATVDREWRFIRAWLCRELSGIRGS